MAMFEIHAVDEQIKALPTVSTASGSIATFDTDMTENLVEVLCNITPVQTGSGTPSPSNPRPITVYDSLTLYHNDINLWNEQWELGMINRTTGVLEPATNRIRSASKIACKENTEYYFKSSVNIFVVTYDIDGNVVESPSGGKDFVYTTKPNVAYMMFYTATGVTSYNNDISINYPSTDTAYHAFNGAYIPFGQTVAQGLLNVGTGKLTIEMLEVDMGNLTWTLAGSGRLNTSIAGVKLYGNTQTSQAKCSWYQVVNGNTVANVDKSLCVSFNNSNVCQVNDSDYNGGNPNDFKTAVTGQKIIYELQTPIEIQLDSTQITALLNENNIWCDTGDTSVKYILSVGKAIS